MARAQQTGPEGQNAAAAAGIPRAAIELLNVRVSQLNGCAYCLDTHGRYALDAGLSGQQLAVFPTWSEAELFTDLERAALSTGETVTVLPEDLTRQADLQRARTVLSAPVAKTQAEATRVDGPRGPDPDLAS